MHVQGECAFVTGGGRGIGRDICIELAEHGITVVVADVDDSREETVEIIESNGNDAVGVGLDLRDPDSVAEAVRRAGERAGPVDILVNNAGIAGPTSPIEEVSLDEWERTISVNLRGAFLCARELIDGMKDRGYGRVVNVSSASGKRAVANRSPYTSSKAGMLGLMRTLAAEGGSHGVTANAVCPGSVSGPRIERVIENEAAESDRSAEEVRREKVEKTLVGSFVESADVASVVAFLCTDAAESITGQAIDITGGKTVH